MYTPHLTRAASDCLLVSSAQIPSHHLCQEMLHDRNQNCAHCLWNGFLHWVAVHIANHYISPISHEITTTTLTKLDELLITHAHVSTNWINYCPARHSTFSRTLDFPSGGGIADDTVVPDNSTTAVMTRNGLFMSATMDKKLYTNIKHQVKCSCKNSFYIIL